MSGVIKEDLKSLSMEGEPFQEVALARGCGPTVQLASSSTTYDIEPVQDLRELRQQQSPDTLRGKGAIYANDLRSMRYQFLGARL